jgi:hypothetical protein
MNGSSEVTREDCQPWVISHPDLCGEVRRKPDAEVAGTIHIAGIERRLVHRRVTVRQFVEQKDREVGDDQRDVDNREPAGRNAI